MANAITKSATFYSLSRGCSKLQIFEDFQDPGWPRQSPHGFSFIFMVFLDFNDFHGFSCTFNIFCKKAINNLFFADFL